MLQILNQIKCVTAVDYLYKYFNKLIYQSQVPYKEDSYISKFTRLYGKTLLLTK